MNLSVIVLTWNSEKFIGRCLESVIAELRKSGLTYEIFVVDNGSNDRTISILQSFETKYPEHLGIVSLGTNRGTTYSRNIALKRAKGSYVCFIDSDVEIQGGVIKYLIQALEGDPQIGLIAPKLINSNGSLQKSTDVFPTVFRKILRYFFLRTIEKRELKLEKIPSLYEVDYAILAFWMVKQEVINKVGYLDENIFYAPEDVDYCLRIWLSGYKITYDTRVFAVHHGQEISRGLKISKATWNHIKGLLYYFRKHRYIFKPPVSVKTKM